MKNHNKAKILVAIIFICIIYIYTAFSSCDAQPVAHVIVLAGQSNCEGVARSDALALKIDSERYAQFEGGFSNISLIRRSSGIHINDFVPCKLGQGTTEAHFGIEIGIAEYLSQNFANEKFYFVKKVHGGTSIDSWFGLSNMDNQSKHYAWLVDDVKTAITMLQQQGNRVVIEAFCWMQGESDADDLDRAQSYKEKLSAMVKAFRNEFSSYNSVSIRFIDGGISDTVEVMPYYQIVNNAKIAISQENDYNFYIDTIAIGLTKDGDSQGDLFHYDSLSMLKLGWEFGKFAMAR